MPRFINRRISNNNNSISHSHSRNEYNPVQDPRASSSRQVDWPRPVELSPPPTPQPEDSDFSGRPSLSRSPETLRSCSDSPQVKQELPDLELPDLDPLFNHLQDRLQQQREAHQRLEKIFIRLRRLVRQEQPDFRPSPWAGRLRPNNHLPGRFRLLCCGNSTRSTTRFFQDLQDEAHVGSSNSPTTFYTIIPTKNVRKNEN